MSACYKIVNAYSHKHTDSNKWPTNLPTTMINLILFELLSYGSNPIDEWMDGWMNCSPMTIYVEEQEACQKKTKQTYLMTGTKYGTFFVAIYGV
ncbi:hypothetical protein DERF_003322 [Dermatophagoides farinae]|uniref:Uncharacterized protein n=1 Tax=Dermatophagoides farinae TaxID=6954 RepID=A0A922LCH3_DERFA|nr:hypothetical protein DERF_003322 [Dermatophagoides farinae]